MLSEENNKGKMDVGALEEQEPALAVEVPVEGAVPPVPLMHQTRRAGTLNEFSAVEMMTARLRELGAPIYGTKAQKWARVLKAENEAAKEEEIQELLKERQTRR